jgi:hypothetical protein
VTLVPVKEVMQAWYKMCEKAESLEELEDLTVLLGRAKEFLIKKNGKQFYVMEQLTALIPLK